MPKKRKSKKYVGKTTKEWRDFGEEFGKQIDKGSKNFSENMENWGKNFGEHMERHGKRWEDRWFYSFGYIGPLIGSIFGIIFFAFGIILLNFINMHLRSVFILMLSNFFSTNIQWFFLASLFFGYCNYFSRRYSKRIWIVSPIINSLRAIFVIWILVSIFILISVYTNVNVITNFSNFIYEGLLPILLMLILIGYLIEIIKKTFCSGCMK